MPRKKRDIRRDYRRAGFTERQGKGDHTIFTHPLLPDNYAVDGVDGKDARDYDELKLRKALRELANQQRKQP